MLLSTLGNRLEQSGGVNYNRYGTSITKDANDVLSVKAGGIQNTHLNGNVVDQVGLVLDSNNKISIKDGGITGSKLNSGIVNTDDLSISNNKIQLANRDTTDGMGKIILRKDQSFASQLTQTNTIYVIRYDYTLTDNVTIPDNCVLEFDGGSIKGTSTLTFQNTEILGTLSGIYHTVGLAGTIKGIVNIAYWNFKYNDNTYDNGVVINKVCSVFKNVYIPAGSLYFTTPIVMSGMQLIRCDATLIYNGTTTNTAAVKVTRGQGVYNFNRIFGQFNINYTEANNTKVIGLDFNSCNGCELSFNYIDGFNEGLRVSDTNSTGCCYNTINVGLISQTNFGIRIFQGPSVTNWCNQNLFLGGRIANWTDWDFNNPTWCVFAYGAKYEGQEDSYDHVNNLTFIGLCIEELNGIYLRNGQYIKIIGTRHEDSTHPLKLVGKCKAVEWNRSYPGGKIDVTENAYCGLSVRSQVSYITQTASNNTPIEIDTTVYRAFTANLFKVGRLLINYLEDTNGALDTREKKMAYPAISTYYFDLNGKLDPGVNIKGMEDDIFFIPNGITKVAITLGSTGGTLKLYNL